MLLWEFIKCFFFFFLPFHLYHLRSRLESWYGQGSNKSQFMFSG